MFHKSYKFFFFSCITDMEICVLCPILGPHFDLYQSLNRLPIWNLQNCSSFPLAFVAGSLQGHWWALLEETTQQSVADHYYLVLPTICCCSLLLGTPNNQLLIITTWYFQQSVADNYSLVLPTISCWSLLLGTPNNQLLTIWHSKQSAADYLAIPSISCWSLLFGTPNNQLLIITMWHSQQSVTDHYYFVLPTIKNWSLLGTPNNQLLVIITNPTIKAWKVHVHRMRNLPYKSKNSYLTKYRRIKLIF